MKWLNDDKMKMVLVGFAAVVVIGGGNTKADFTFGEPTNLGTNVNSSSCDDGLNISSDGLSIIFSSDRPNMGTWDLYITTRETTKDEWGPAVNLGSTINGSRSESYPSLSADGLELYYTAPFWQAGWTQFGGADLWVSKRSTVSDEWSAPVNLGELVNTSFHDTEPSIAADGLELYFSSDRPGGYGEWNIWVTKRQTRNDPWEEPVNLGPIINSGHEGWANILTNGLELLFGSGRPGGHGEGDIWLSRRKLKDDPWQEPVNLGPPVNDSGDQWAPCISHDGSMLYFTDSDKQPKYGCYDLWQVSIETIVDFNGDSIVDGTDMCIMVDHWGTDYSLCDIGPMPWGDGIIDVEDLKVLAKHLFEEVDDPTLVAHWALDESEGMFATDSVGNNDAVVLGGFEWQPTGGQIEGALKLDGVSGYAIAGEVLNPAESPFSVIAWIKGGAPGQVAISQQNMANWLLTDAEGNLMTELKCTGRSAGYLFSETVITDGQWHCIGLVWDGSNRTLYVDDVAVAEDTKHGLVGSQMGLYIGTGKGMEAGTYFSGLIDDVRIYNRVVSP